MDSIERNLKLLLDSDAVAILERFLICASDHCLDKTEKAAQYAKFLHFSFDYLLKTANI